MLRENVFVIEPERLMWRLDMMELKILRNRFDLPQFAFDQTNITLGTFAHHLHHSIVKLFFKFLIAIFSMF